MLDVSVLREHKDDIIQALSKRGLDAKPMVEEVLEADEKRRSLQAILDQNLAKANALAKEIGQLYSSGKANLAQELKEETSKLKSENKNLQAQLNQAVEDLQALRYNIPNVPHLLVPNGQSEDDNEEVFRSGEAPQLQDDALPHWELAAKYKLIDFELGNKITGAGFSCIYW